jgi:very-long-chain enoyl-CoA reductase
MGMGVLHFLKRELETVFVHVFSRNSMPFNRALINMFHYWILFGLLCGIEIFHFWTDPQYSKTTTFALVGLWGVSRLLCRSVKY